MGTTFKATCLVTCLVLALATCRQIDGEQSRVQTFLISDISGDDNDQLHQAEDQKKSLFPSLHGLVRNDFNDNDDGDPFYLYLMCQFDFLSWMCERLTSLWRNKLITDQNKQPEAYHDVQPEINQNLQPTNEQSKHTNTNQYQPGTETETEMSKQLERDHNVKLKMEKNKKLTTMKAIRNEAFDNIDFEIQENGSREDCVGDIGTAGSLLCQICASIERKKVRKRCETRFCNS